MKITTVNVGQGHLTIVTHNDEAIVVDSRIPPNDESYDFVKKRLAETVSGKNVVGLMLTGFDADHTDVRGVAWVLKKYQPRWVMYPKYHKDTEAAKKTFAVITEQVDARSSSRTPLARIPIRLDRLESRHINEERQLSKHFAMEVFSPHIEDMDSSNNASLVVKLTSPELSFLVTGDTENARWDVITRLFRDKIKSDVLQAPHHGSKNGITQEAMKRIAADTVLISAGVDNQFGHPHAEALQIYCTHTNKVYSTQSGTLFTERSGWLLPEIKTTVL